QALVLADGEGIDLRHFPSLTRELTETPEAAVPLAPPGLKLEELERWYVLETLKRAAGNRTRAARELGLSLRGLQYKLHRYAVGLAASDSSSDDELLLEVLGLLDAQRFNEASCLSADRLEQIMWSSASIPTAAQKHFAECLHCVSEFTELQSLYFGHSD